MININNLTPKILVIGDLIIDNYLWGDCNRISPEAPVQVVNIEKVSKALGGAGNVVNNLRELGSFVDVISVLGDDENSRNILDLLKEIGVDSDYILTQKGRISSKKSRIIASQQQVVRYDEETSTDIDKSLQKKIVQIFDKIIANYDLVLISDYGKGLLTKYLTQSIIKISNRHNKKVLIDPKGLDYTKYHGAYLLTPNKNEASEATKITINDEKSLTKAILKLKRKCNLYYSIITLSEQGVAIYDDCLRIHKTNVKEVYDVTGAGDTILSALGFSISLGNNIDTSIEFANNAAGVVVGKIGSATASINEINDYESSINKSNSESHIKSKEELIKLIEEHKSQGKKIVFTNGCFDLIHIGHIKYLESAKSFGDILVLGLNSDKSVK